MTQVFLSEHSKIIYDTRKNTIQTQWYGCYDSLWSHHLRRWNIMAILILAVQEWVAIEVNVTIVTIKPPVKERSYDLKSSTEHTYYKEEYSL